MRYCLYLGTRGCRGLLEDALDNYHDALEIAVPADPKLLGPIGAEIEQDFADVASVLAEQALQRAHEIADREARELAGVFGQDPPDPGERIGTSVLEGDLATNLGELLNEREAGAVYVARDVLEILDEASMRLDPVLDEHDVELVAR